MSFVPNQSGFDFSARHKKGYFEEFSVFIHEITLDPNDKKHIPSKYLNFTFHKRKSYGFGTK